MSDPLARAQHKLKELKEALNVIESVEDKVIWACDFTSYPDIAYMLNPIADVAGEVRDKIEDEIYHLEEQIEEYSYKLAEFEEDNTISV